MPLGNLFLPLMRLSDTGGTHSSIRQDSSPITIGAIKLFAQEIFPLPAHPSLFRWHSWLISFAQLFLGKHSGLAIFLAHIKETVHRDSLWPTYATPCHRHCLQCTAAECIGCSSLKCSCLNRASSNDMLIPSCYDTPYLHKTFSIVGFSQA